MASFATSYIPTTSAQVTRNVDLASMTNFGSWYNQAQGSFYAESDNIYNNAGNSFIYELWNNTISVTYSEGILYVSNGTVYLTGGATANINGGLISAGSTNKYISSVSQGGNAVFAVNGVVKGTISSNLRTSTPDTVYIGADRNSGYLSMLNGHIRKITYYPQALSSANLVALTS